MQVAAPAAATHSSSYTYSALMLISIVHCRIHQQFHQQRAQSSAALPAAVTPALRLPQPLLPTHLAASPQSRPLRTLAWLATAAAGLHVLLQDCAGRRLSAAAAGHCAERVCQLQQAQHPLLHILQSL